MRIRKPGKIADKLWFLGQEDCCAYLLEGENGSILINGGVSCIVPDMLEQFRTFRIDESKINKFLILHSHFDHVGILPFFKRRYPGMVVYGSSRSLDILQKPKVIEAINVSSHYVMEKNGYLDVCSKYDLDWRGAIPGEAVADGDRIELGDFDVCIIETPGHSPCSVSAYIPQLKALFPSDAGGIPNGDKIVTYGTSSFSKFEESLKKLRTLDVAYLCSDHCGYVTGDEAAGYIHDAINAAEARRLLMLDMYRRTGDVDETARELALRFRDENIMNMVPYETFVEAQRQMVMYLAGLK